jgi:hypothetical protein
VSDPVVDEGHVWWSWPGYPETWFHNDGAEFFIHRTSFHSYRSIREKIGLWFLKPNRMGSMIHSLETSDADNALLVTIKVPPRYLGLKSEAS